jgi:hypothetical protein
MNIYMDDVRVNPYIGWMTVRTVETMQDVVGHWCRGALQPRSRHGRVQRMHDAQKHIGDMLSAETTFLNWCPHVMDGTKLVRWMIETGHWPKYKPAVHSANPAGGQRMRQLIEQFFGRPAMGPMFSGEGTVMK